MFFLNVAASYFMCSIKNEEKWIQDIGEDGLTKWKKDDILQTKQHSHAESANTI